MLTVSIERMVPITPWPCESTLLGLDAVLEPPVIQFRNVPWNNGRPAMSCDIDAEVEGCEGCSAGGKDEQSRQGSTVMDAEPESNEESGEEDV